MRQASHCAMASAKRRRYSWPWKILVLTLALVCFSQGGTSWVAPRKASPVAGPGQVRSPGSTRVLRRSWNIGPLGPVESAEAFRIYYLPFVEPLDIDGTILDQLFGGWLGPFAPLLVGAIVFWIQGQIYAVRREQEGRVLGSAAKAVGDAAAATASGAAQSLTEKLQRVPAEQWLKLFLCLALDLAGGGLVRFLVVSHLPVSSVFWHSMPDEAVHSFSQNPLAQLHCSTAERTPQRPIGIDME